MTRDEMLKVVAEALDDDHRESGFTLGQVEHGEHRRMAALVLDALGLEQVGWFVWEDPESAEWSAVDLDWDDLHHFPHLPLYRLGARS